MTITPALAPLLSSAEWAREPDERGGGRSRESPATAGLLHFLGAAAATTLGLDRAPIDAAGWDGWIDTQGD